MRPGSPSAKPRVAGPLVALAVVLAALALAAPSLAPAASPLRASTPKRRQLQPGEVGADPRLLDPGADARRRRRSTAPAASTRWPSASFAPVADTERRPLHRQRPLFVRQGNAAGLLLGDRDQQPRAGSWSSPPATASTPARAAAAAAAPGRGYLEFVPAYTDGLAPVRRLRRPPQRGLRAEAVDQARQPQLRHRRLPQSSPTPKASTSPTRSAAAPRSPSTSAANSTSRPSAIRARSAACRGAAPPTSATTALTYRIPGPPTIAIRCHWAARRQRRRLADRRTARRSTA